MNYSKKRNLYKTTSLPVACVLSMEFPILSVDKSDPKRAFFVFEQSPELEEMVSRYWENALKVDPQIYSNQMKALKGRLYDGE